MGFKFCIVFFLLVSFLKLPASCQGLYDTNHITKIELTFAEKDWEYPLHYYYSLKKGDRHIGDAVVNGRQFEKVGVRFKGFSSYNRNNAKNPLNIKLDHTDKKANYQGFETLKLSNGNLDPSWLREILAYQIARKYMTAPQSNYAQVFVNGKYYGLFGNTENIDGKFGKRYLNSSKDNVVIKGNSPLGPFRGKRSSLEFLGTDTTAYYTAYELESSHGWTELFKLINILNNEPVKIETILNMDAAIWMLAFNNVLVNLDSYSDFQQNYYLIQDDNGRFNLILWDVNLAFDGLGKPQGVHMQHHYDPLAKQNDGRFPLINLVLNNPRYRKIYFAHCRTILEENFSNDWYKKEADNYRTLINDAVKNDTNWAFGFEDFQKNYHSTVVKESAINFPYPGITELMDARTKYLQNHPEYKKSPPIIADINTDFPENDSSKVRIAVKIKNTKNAAVFYRNKTSDIFQKMPLSDDGNDADKTAKDGIYSTSIPLKEGKIEYYIYAENDEAAMFSPQRAEHEFYKFDKKDIMPF